MSSAAAVDTAAVKEAEVETAVTDPLTTAEFLDDKEDAVIKNEKVMLSQQVVDETDDGQAVTAVVAEAEDASGVATVVETAVAEEEVEVEVNEDGTPTLTEVQEEVVTATAGENLEGQPQIYIIQTTDGSMPMETAEVVVADDSMQVYETVTALEQLSRGHVVTTADGGEIIQVYEEVVLPEGATLTGAGGGTASAGIIDQFVDVAEVEVGDGRSASPIKIETVSARLSAGSFDAPGGNAAAALAAAGAGKQKPKIRTCGKSLHLVGNLANHTRGLPPNVSDLTCLDCGKLFKVSNESSATLAA